MEEKRWYAVHTYSGYENKVKTNLERRIESMNMEDYIFRVMIPTEDVEEKKNNKVKVNKCKVFPGYVLVEMIMTDDSWYVVRNTTGVTGFVGTGAKAVPLHEAEVKV
ncbi:MAG: transcription termination/antitermination protein NusG, partial [Peptococcaceae bacterium]|nr:transcription termination/antitermination protein NusG [Peptococcaceae bacterium]